MTGRHVVAGELVRGSAVLTGHRSPSRRWCPDVRGFPGGHGEPRDLQPHEHDELRWVTGALPD